MKLVSSICRYLLGAIFVIFGLNGFLHFLKPHMASSSYATQFMTTATDSHFLVIVFLLHILAGISLLVGRFVPLALVVLAAILANILNYHITMDPSGIAVGLLAAILWILAALPYRRALSPILEP
jgi:uncharacterized membrane protein YphA (DoxX/SURF4 family)